MEIGMTAFADEPCWMTDERRWFARHSHRTHRLRRAHPGEWPAGRKNADWTIVRQVAPGTRSITSKAILERWERLESEGRA
jgi:hypothetical protein